MNDEWRTPKDLFEKLDEEFYFDWDAACDSHNCLTMSGCFEHGEDSLQLDWDKYASSIWLNPPYSRGKIEPFMEKALITAEGGVSVVCLVRFDPSTKWFQTYVDKQANEIRMLARRVRFQGAPSAYNFPTCIVVYLPEYKRNSTVYKIWDWK